jgi:pimeloyl-ACP methyl ester carboxylesterase
LARQDFEPESMMLATQLLDRPVHLVGMSYGGIVAMYAAAIRPANVLSLTVIEPPCSGVARGVPVTDAYGRELRALIEDTEQTPAEALNRFFPAIGVPLQVDEPLPPVLERGVLQLIGARPPDEADPPLELLRQAGFPILVVSGDHLPANEVICDTIAEQTGGKRAIVRGYGHLIPDSGEPFNKLLEQHFTAR